MTNVESIEKKMTKTKNNGNNNLLFLSSFFFYIFNIYHVKCVLIL